MDRQAMAVLWSNASTIDESLRPSSKRLNALCRKMRFASTYSRRRLFSAVLTGEPVIFNDAPISVRRRSGEQGVPAVLNLLREGFGRRTRVVVRVGPSAKKESMTVSELVRRWERTSSRVCVTDLHFRDTPVEGALNLNPVSDFNLLLLGSDRMARQEMMTLVVSSRGSMTDSHSDDPDGSNHCFIGTKLWLAWDTVEGRMRGLEDCERDPVSGRANFDLATFLALESSCWFTVAQGQTLFLPGRMTHKVITLEDYLGFGSFNVSLAGCISTLSRWYLQGPLWSMQDPSGETVGLVDEIAQTAMEKIRKLRRCGPPAQERWGLGCLPRALRNWSRTTLEPERATLLANPAFARLISQVRSHAYT
jgi:hypothetical protein